jgi:hypothetical protein
MSAAALDAIKALVRLVLEREGHQPAAFPSVVASTDLQLLLQTIPNEDLLATIQRHRLICLLQGDSLLRELLAEIQPRLKALGRFETLSALALASLTSEMASLFEQAAIPMLVIKGIPLAVQTTGSITSRGRGDLDLFVDPKQLGQAIELLRSHGFNRLPDFPQDIDNLWGRYSRWVGYELSLVRERHGKPQWIDLHWALSNVRGPLPNFTNAWESHEEFFINNQTIATLCRLDAFQHSCYHAAKDQWDCLRSLIDICRLEQQICRKDMMALYKSRIIQSSQALAADLIRPGALAMPYNQKLRDLERIRVQAKYAQLLPIGIWHREGQGQRSIGKSLKRISHMLRICSGPKDIVRILLNHALGPKDLVDKTTGADHSLPGLIRTQARKLTLRL